MMPSAKELSYFYTAAITENLSKSASQLGVSQPALTLAIKRLELTIGASLFIRHKKGVTLSKAGKHFLAHVKPLIHYWENAKLETRNHQNEVQGKYRIGCHSIYMMRLTKILSLLLKNYPNLEFDIHHDISRSINEKIINLSIDIGIVANPIQHPDLIITKLYESEYSMWMSDDPIIKKKLYSKNNILICDPNLAQTNILLKKLKRSKINFSRMLTTSSIESIATLTAAGCGIGMLPDCYVATQFADSLRRVPKSPVHSNEICLVYRHEIRHLSAVKEITNKIKEHLKKEQF